MRGKELLIARHFDDARITPACAGKSREYRVSDERSLGSPPRMRGKDKVNLKFSDPAWITPAYAGKSAVAIIR